MIDGDGQGLLRHGREPGRRLGQRASCSGSAMANLDWLVVRDLQMIETATFWKDGPEIETGELRTEDIGTEVFFLPAAAHTEKDGIVHQHPAPAAVAPQGGRAAGRLPLRAVVHATTSAGASARSCAGSTEPTRPAAPRPHVGLPDGGPARRPDAEAVLARDQRLRRRDGRPLVGLHRAQGRRLDGLRLLDLLRLLRRRASTRPPAASPARSRTGSRPSGAGRGRANRRILYNRASADPDGRPWSRAQGATSGGTPRQGKWTGHDVPDFTPTSAPDYVPRRGRRRPRRARAATSRSSCRPTARAGCSRPPG